MDKLIKKEEPRSGGAIKSVEEFTKLAKAEYITRYNALLDEFKGRRDQIQRISDLKIDEFKLISTVIAANDPDTTKSLPAVGKLEMALAELDYDTCAASFSLDFWRKEYGEQMIVPILCDLMNYFLKQFQVKESLSDIQIMQLASKLLYTQPQLRINELLFCLNNAAAGKYGPTYQRIGMDTILTWLASFYEQSSVYLEGKHANNRQDSARGEAPWEVQERQLQAYAAEQKRKFEINNKLLSDIKKREKQNEELEARKKIVSDAKEKILTQKPE